MKRILTRAPSNVAAAAGSRPLFGAAPAAAARLPSASTAGPRQLYILGSHEAARQNRNSNHAALHRLAAVVSRSSRACTSNAGPAILRAPSRPPSVIRGGEASNRSHAVRELVTQNAVALGLKPSSSLRQGMSERVEEVDSVMREPLLPQPREFALLTTAANEDDDDDNDDDGMGMTVGGGYGDDVDAEMHGLSYDAAEVDLAHLRLLGFGTDDNTVNSELSGAPERDCANANANANANADTVIDVDDAGYTLRDAPKEFRLEPQAPGDGHGQIFGDREELADTLRHTPRVDENLHKFAALISLGRLEEAEQLLLGKSMTAQEVWRQPTRTLLRWRWFHPLPVGAECAVNNDVITFQARNGGRGLDNEGCIEGTTTAHFTKLMRAYIESPTPNHIQARAIFWRMDDLGKLDLERAPSYEAYVLLLLTRYRDMRGKKASHKQHRKAIQNGRAKIRNIIKAMKMRGFEPGDVFRKTSLEQDQAVDVLKAIRLVWPDFRRRLTYKSNAGLHNATPPNDKRARDSNHPRGVSSATLTQWQNELGLEVSLSIPALDATTMKLRIGSDGDGDGDGDVDVDGDGDGDGGGNLHGTDELLHVDDKSAAYTMALFRPAVVAQLARDRAVHVALTAQGLNSLGRRTMPGQRINRDINDYLFGISDEQLADAVLPILDQELRGHSAGALLHQLISSVGCAVYRQYFLNEHKDGLADQLRTIYTQYDKVMADPDLRQGRNNREVWEDLEEKYHAKYPDLLGQSGYVEWPMTIIKRVGVRLVDLVVSVANVSALEDTFEGGRLNNDNMMAPSLLPAAGAVDRVAAGDDASDAEDAEALYHTYDFVGAKKVSLVRCHPAVDRLLRNQAAGAEKVAGKKVLAATSLPMLTIPKPWTCLRSSPYLVMPQALVRCGQDAFQHLSLLAREEHSMTEVYDALNTLGSTPWTINERVLDVIRPLLVDGGSWPDLDVPAHSIAIPAPVPRDESLTPTQRRELREERAAIIKLRNENAGLRAEFTTRVAIAEKFKGKTFYLPHNLDFRGRAYVMPPHLSHLGCDGTRALLTFAEAKPLGARGLFWLKVHLANLFGVDKVSFAERVAFTEENMHRIHDVADHPWLEDGSAGWWQESENPWQTLSACCELSDAMRSEDPEAFESKLPVHQDGTCNGLQHYAALGGDVDGATAVNLCPVPGDDKPQDVYMAVVDMVNAMVQRHADGDFSGKHPGDSLQALQDNDFVKELAQQLLVDGPIARKTVKQTIMTSVYGVTFIGGRDQVYKQIKNKDYNGMDDKTKFLASGYLVSCVFTCLGDMFGGADALKTWLSDAAVTIASTGSPVTWVTPMGMPVVQPYHKKTTQRIQAGSHKLLITNTTDAKVPPDPMKQRSAFPPNYVHSLDSTHMMYTANACGNDDVTFVAVHDSYWTHASTIDTMNVHCREQFVRLHSQPLLGRLSEYFDVYFNGAELKASGSGKGQPAKYADIRPPPERGDFDLNEVIKSKYFFN